MFSNDSKQTRLTLLLNGTEPRSPALPTAVVSSAYSGMEPETIAVTAWTRMDKFPVSDFNTKRISDFISEHQKRFNPEGF